MKRYALSMLLVIAASGRLLFLPFLSHYGSLPAQVLPGTETTALRDYLTINGVMLLITAALIPARLQIDGLWPAILGGIVMSIIALILERVLGVNDGNNRRGGGKRDNTVIIMDKR